MYVLEYQFSSSVSKLSIGKFGFTKELLPAPLGDVLTEDILTRLWVKLWRRRSQLRLKTLPQDVQL